MTETATNGAEPIGQRLRRLRLEAGLSQRDLAEPGVTYAYISRIEAGARRPSTKALRAIAPKLNVTADELEFGPLGIKQNPTFRAMHRRIVALEAELRIARDAERKLQRRNELLQDDLLERVQRL